MFAIEIDTGTENSETFTEQIISIIHIYIKWE